MAAKVARHVNPSDQDESLKMQTWSFAKSERYIAPFRKQKNKIEVPKFSKVAHDSFFKRSCLDNDVV